MIKKVKITSMDLLVKLITPVIEGGKSAKFTVVGDSMYPLFRDGIDNVIVVKSENIKKRDIILYSREDGSFVLHRIVGKADKGYKLCGDNQMIIEYPVKSENIIAVVSAFERNGKTFSVNALWYKIYSLIWSTFISQRPLILKLSRKIKKFFRRGNPK